jgi:hypothetical protein
VYANLGARLLLAQVKDARRAPDGEWRHPEIEDPEAALPQHLDLLTAWLESDL